MSLGAAEDPGHRATIRRVAEAAGVSTATVSRVMNGRATVAPALAARVRAAAEALRYEPHPVARGLAMGRTTTVSLVVPDLSNPMFQGVLRGLSRAAAACGHRLLVAESREDPVEEPLLAVEARRRTDGLVLAAPRMSDAQLRDLAPRLAPLVLLNRQLPGAGVSSLSVDHAAGVTELGRHLAGLGHRRVAYLSGPSASAADRDRRTGLSVCVGPHGLREVIEIPGGVTWEDGDAAAPAVLASGASAVIAFNDLVALGLLGNLRERGVDVPGDLSVTGFDDITFSRYATPALTTAAVPQADLGRQAWNRMWSLLQGEEPEDDVHVRPRLVIRSSTGPAPS